MTSAFLRPCMSALILMVIAGCSRAPGPQGDAAGGRTFGETLLWIDPLKACGDHQVTTVHWSKEAFAKGPANIELGDVDPGRFARAGEAGQKDTGPWAYPGAVIVLRGDDGEVRARQIIRGPGNCPAG